MDGDHGIVQCGSIICMKDFLSPYGIDTWLTQLAALCVREPFTGSMTLMPGNGVQASLLR
jgi:hypothetical protein